MGEDDKTTRIDVDQSVGEASDSKVTGVEIGQADVVQIGGTDADTARDLADDRRQEDALHRYQEFIESLLLVRDLRHAIPDSEVRRVAHSRTLSVLRQLSAKRKGALVRYLCDGKLVQGPEHPVIGLSKVDLSFADLFMLDLSGADLQEARLTGARLLGIGLEGANLAGADLDKAKLSSARLDRAILEKASFRGATLIGAFIKEANLSYADLDGSDCTGAWFDGANLSWVSAMDTDFHRSFLSESNLEGANLYKANLTGAWLDGIHNLTQDQLSKTESYRDAKGLSKDLHPDTRE